MMTPTVFEPPAQDAYIVDADRKVVGHISLCGAFLKMPTATGVQLFEMHSYFGPVPLRKDGTEAIRVRKSFYENYEKWIAGGKLVDGDLCIIGEYTTHDDAVIAAQNFIDKHKERLAAK